MTASPVADADADAHRYPSCTATRDSRSSTDRGECQMIRECLPNVLVVGHAVNREFADDGRLVVDIVLSRARPQEARSCTRASPSSMPCGSVSDMTTYELSESMQSETRPFYTDH
ncbi:hypothetical protein [Curtobacterium sp. MCPF17_021]|uniref:hypothetical protein n=1 Tax=Curtobacterium sp. MCPF17_021 TaxID=2175639 RepID=UPI0011B51E7E|nr:hypothetical protein [Curtobacterium sp. MCPF17_021]WIE82960.1 hypothetical protein DEJ29_016490 [Curtobacterium sp. MCPF17_021]